MKETGESDLKNKKKQNIVLYSTDYLLRNLYAGQEATVRTWHNRQVQS